MKKKLTPKEIKQIVDNSPGNLWDRKVEESEVQKNCCTYCAKKLGKNPRYIHVTVMGNIVRNDITETQLNKIGGRYSSQGAFPVGSGCVKKLLGDKVEEYSVTFSE